MADRKQGKTGVKPKEKERNLALDKEELKDIEPQEEDQEHVRGGAATKRTCYYTPSCTG